MDKRTVARLVRFYGAFFIALGAFLLVQLLPYLRGFGGTLVVSMLMIAGVLYAGVSAFAGISLMRMRPFARLLVLWLNCFNVALMLQLAILLVLHRGIGTSMIPLLVAGTIFFAFSLSGCYLFGFNKDVKTLFQAKPSNTKGSSVN